MLQARSEMKTQKKDYLIFVLKIQFFQYFWAILCVCLALKFAKCLQEKKTENSMLILTPLKLLPKSFKK